MELAIQVEDLVKRFASFTAVDGISLAVERGEIFGILGPNGAGKTTTLEIIEGLQKPTQGKVTVLGLDILKNTAEIKARIGVQLQSSAYFNYLSLKEILVLLASFYPKSSNPDELLDQVGLLDKSTQRINQLSGGQIQRFTVAASLINDPELVILDEPTTGLDPQARHNLWDLIQDIHSRGVTVVLTTHYMEEAEALCNRIAIMDRGKLLAVDTPRNLISQLDATYTVKLVLPEPLTEAQIASFNGSIASIQALEENTYVLHLKNTPQALNGALDEIVKSNLNLKHMDITPVTLEDVFLTMTGHELRD